MKKLTGNLTRSNLKTRLVTYFTVFCFLFQFSVPSVAAIIHSSEIEAYFNSEPSFLFEYDNSEVQFTAQSYVESSHDSRIVDLRSFYGSLVEENSPILSEPVMVPIVSGGITIFVPVRDQFKLIGTPSVQNRYVRMQVYDALGRHLIDGGAPSQSSEALQSDFLYQNAKSYALLNPTKKYGEALTEEESSNHFLIGADMIWPEIRRINGENVLVPVLYLTRSTKLQREINEHTIEFEGTSALGELQIEDVEIKLGREAFLSAASLLNTGVISSDYDVDVYVSGDFHNLSGLVQGNEGVNIVANRVINETLVHRYDLGGQQGTRYGEHDLATIESANGDVVVRSYSDILNLGANVSAENGAITFSANGDIYIGTQQIYSTSESNRDTSTIPESSLPRGWQSTNTTNLSFLSSNLSAKEAISLIAEGGIKIDGSNLFSEGSIEILAGLGITIEHELSQRTFDIKSKFGKQKVNESIFQTHAIRSMLDAGAGIRLHTEYGDVTLKSAAISSSDGTQIQADRGGVNLLLTTETNHYSYSAVQKGMFTTSTLNKGSSAEASVPNTIVGGLSVKALDGLYVEYEGLKGLECEEFNNQNGIAPRLLESSGGETFYEDPCLRANILKLSETPGMEWMLTALEMADADPDSVEWSRIALQHKTWHESNTSLSPAFAAVISIAVVVAMGPAGYGLSAASFGGGVLGSAMFAGATTLASQATLALGNGLVNGDVAGAMEDLASSDTVRAVATSMAVAGTIAAIDAVFFDLDSNAIQEVVETAEDVNSTASQVQAAVDTAQLQVSTNVVGGSLLDQVGQAVVDSTVRAGITTAVYGGSVKDEFVLAMATNVINSIAADIANEIGDFATANPDWALLSKYIGHAALGCALGEASSAINDEFGATESEKGCASGLGGAVVSVTATELYERKVLADRVSSWYQDEFEGPFDPKNPETIAAVKQKTIEFARDGVDIAQLSAAITAFAVGWDVDTAAQTSQNAAANNFLPHLIIAGIVAYVLYEGEGNLLIGLDRLNEPDSILQRLYSEAADFGSDVIEMSMEEAPNETELLIDIFRGFGEVIGDGVQIAVETCTGFETCENGLVSAGEYYEKLDPATKRLISGTGHAVGVTGIVFPVAHVTKMGIINSYDVTVDMIGDLTDVRWQDIPVEQRDELLGAAYGAIVEPLESQTLALASVEGKTTLIQQTEIWGAVDRNDGYLGEQLIEQALLETTGIDFRTTLKNNSNNGADLIAVDPDPNTKVIWVVEAKSSVNARFPNPASLGLQNRSIDWINDAASGFINGQPLAQAEIDYANDLLDLIAMEGYEVKPVLATVNVPRNRQSTQSVITIEPVN